MFCGYFFHYFYGRAEMPAGKVRWTPPKHISNLKGQNQMKNNFFPSVLFHTNLPGKEHNKLWPSMAWEQSSGTLRTFSVVGPDTTYIFICRYLPPRLADKQYRGRSREQKKLMWEQSTLINYNEAFYKWISHLFFWPEKNIQDRKPH